MFTSIIGTIKGTLSIQTELTCMVVSLILGYIIAFTYMLQGRYTKNFVITLITLPVLVQTVIKLVNGNLTTSIIIMGAFSLARFGSPQESSKDIRSILLTIVVGLATGMGLISFAVVITILVSLVIVVLSKSNIIEKKELSKDLKIIIPEILNYSDIFEDLFQKYTEKYSLNRVKTTNMGSMYELNYSVIMKDEKKEKEFIDELRCRNGNLTIICSRRLDGKEDL